jgi:hypothetical protein
MFTKLIRSVPGTGTDIHLVFNLDLTYAEVLF